MSRAEDATQEAADVVWLTDEVGWIAESLALPDGRCQHVSVYLIRGAASTLVVDSGSFHHRDRIAERIEQALGARGVDALVLSHSDYPHSANIGSFRQRWGDFEIVASCGNAEVQGLPYATRARIGQIMDVKGRRLRFLDPPLADRSHTSWIYDEASRVLFAADGFGVVHEPDQGHWTSRDYPQGIPAEAIHEFHRAAIPWLPFAEPERLDEAFQELFEGNPPSWVAPIHGAPIAAADLGDFRSKLMQTVRALAAGDAS